MHAYQNVHCFVLFFPRLYISNFDLKTFENQNLCFKEEQEGCECWSEFVSCWLTAVDQWTGCLFKCHFHNVVTRQPEKTLSKRGRHLEHTDDIDFWSNCKLFSTPDLNLYMTNVIPVRSWLACSLYHSCFGAQQLKSVCCSLWVSKCARMNKIS